MAGSREAGLTRIIRVILAYSLLQGSRWQQARTYNEVGKRRTENRRMRLQQLKNRKGPTTGRSSTCGCRLLLLRAAVTKQLLTRHWTMVPPIEQVPPQRMGELLGLIRNCTECSMILSRLLILQKLTRKKMLMTRLQEDRGIGTEDLLSSGLIPSCPSFT